MTLIALSVALVLVGLYTTYLLYDTKRKKAALITMADVIAGLAHGDLEAEVVNDNITIREKANGTVH